MTYALPSRLAIFPQLLQVLVRHPVAALILGIGLLGTTSSTVGAALASTDLAANNLSNGVHVFGESPEANQLGTTYMVVEIHGREVIGGFYQPASSFDCFDGQITGNEMALEVTDSYAQTTHPFSLALQASNPIASQSPQGSELVPSGFYPLAELSSIDRQVLQVCRSQK